MVMLPPWSNPDPASAPPKKAAKKPAKKATPRKKPAADPVAEQLAAAVVALPAKKSRAKAVKKTAPAAAKRTPASTAPPEPKPAPTERSRPARQLGAVEAAVLKELQDAGVAHSALAQSAIAMARNVDEAETAAGASSAARELRIVLPLARTTVNPLSPPAEPEKSEGEGNVVGPTRLDTLRKRAAKRAAT